MRTIPNKLSPVWVGESGLLLQQILKERPQARTAIVTDDHVRAHCLPLLEGFLKLFDIPVWSLPAGETYKQIDQVRILWDQMAGHGMDRQSRLIALGGGMITDLAGFAAGTYMRGIELISVPTTLLAQVDAALGGKTGVDLGPLKNYIGLFRQPSHIILDHRFLSTLTPRQVNNGMAEVIKHALIAGGEEWEYWKDAKGPAEGLEAHQIARSAAIKLRIVEEDPSEKGLRRILNMGHTIGHALESIALENGLDVLHGEAIAAGLWCECHVSHQKKIMTDPEWDTVREVLEKYFPKRWPFSVEEDRLSHYLLKDKKNVEGHAIMSALIRPGEYQIEVRLSPDEAMQSIHACMR